MGGMEATTPRAICSASAEVRPDSGCGMAAIAARMASYKSAEVSPGCDVGIEAMVASTIRSTSSWDSPDSGWDMPAIVARMAFSTSADVSPGSVRGGASTSAISARTISSTSARDSPASPPPQDTRRKMTGMANAHKAGAINLRSVIVLSACWITVHLRWTQPKAAHYCPPTTTARSRAGQRLCIARVVGEAHPYLDDLAVVGCLEGVGGTGRSRYFRVPAGQPLVTVAALVNPSASEIPEVFAVSVWPTCAVPLMVGTPVAGVLPASARTRDSPMPV